MPPFPPNFWILTSGIKFSLQGRAIVRNLVLLMLLITVDFGSRRRTRRKKRFNSRFLVGFLIIPNYPD